VDDLAYEDELDDVESDLTSDHLVDAADYVSVSWGSAGLSRRSTIAVINAAGVITSGRSGFDPVNGALVGSDTIVEAIREARANRSGQGDRLARRQSQAARRWPRM
jgi:ClpP class serine protease